MAKLEGIKYKAPQGVRESILTALRQAIITGQLKPGGRVTERMLSEHFGTSTMPVKEALRILETEGLVETIPRKGTVVSDFASIHLTEIYTIRAVLEGLAASFAARKATPAEIAGMENLLAKSKEYIDAGNYDELVKLNTRFHEAIRAASNNSFLQHLIEGIVSYDLIFRRVVLTSSEEQRRGWEEHCSVVRSIKERRPDEAEARLRQHIIRSGQKAMDRRGEELKVGEPVPAMEK